MERDRLEEKVKEFIARGKAANTHAGKLLVLSKFLEEIFAVNVEDLLPGIEKFLGSRVIGVKGRADLVFAGVVLELKLNLTKEWDDVHRELIKYFQCLREGNPDKKYVAIATDLVKFRAFIPKIVDDKVADIAEIGAIDTSTALPSELLVWIDSFMFSRSDLPPTAEDLKIRFGSGSPTHAVALEDLRRMWEVVGNEPEVTLKMKLWAKNMQIVYGSQPESEVFIDHTYLVTIVKLIIYLRLSGAHVMSDEDAVKALNGQYFVDYGISNLIEEDFFTWILHQKVVKDAVEVSKRISKALLNYDVSLVDEDLFKEIYQQIVQQGERHRIGEYYTPEWLSEITTRTAIETWREDHKGAPTILDPSCGSGTFITNVIHFMKKELQQEETSNDAKLSKILSRVMGLDVNPLAAIIARANYIIALGELIQYAKNISIPIYIADSIKIPSAVKTMFNGVEVYDFEADGYHLQIPISVSSNRETFGTVIRILKEAITSYQMRRNRTEAIKIFEWSIKNLLGDDELVVLKNTLNCLMTLVDNKLDSIWIFMLNNIYAPLSIKTQKFDILLSNPPWIVMRSIDNESYQDFLKKQVFNYRLLDSDQVHLFTHMEMATLFFCRCSDLYLADTGTIAFLMPISVLTAAFQHRNFKRFKNPKIELTRILNFEGMDNIFSLPVCVLIGKKGAQTTYPVLSFKYRGQIDRRRRNEKLVNISLTSDEYEYEPPVAPKVSEYSYYYNKVKVGSSIVPRNFWFVEFALHPTLRTINPSKPLVRTSEIAAKVSKKEWRDIRMQGNVEAEFIFATLLGKDMIPFGHLPFRPLMLPIERLSNGFRMLDEEKLRMRGASDAAKWFHTAQQYWVDRRTDKSEESFPSVIDRLDYQRLLSEQNPAQRYLVSYNARGADSLACVIDRKQLPPFSVDHSTIYPACFVVDYTTYMFETNNAEEAHYLCAILNSTPIHKEVKPFQPRGLYGKRDVGRRVFMLPIPKFDKDNADHKKLAKLSKQCHKSLENLKFSKKGFRGMRNEAALVLKTKIEEINTMTETIIHISTS